MSKDTGPWRRKKQDHGAERRRSASGERAAATRAETEEVARALVERVARDAAAPDRVSHHIRNLLELLAAHALLRRVRFDDIHVLRLADAIPRDEIPDDAQARREMLARRLLPDLVSEEFLAALERTFLPIAHAHGYQGEVAEAVTLAQFCVQARRQGKSPNHENALLVAILELSLIEAAPDDPRFGKPPGDPSRLTPEGRSRARLRSALAANDPAVQRALELVVEAPDVRVDAWLGLGARDLEGRSPAETPRAFIDAIIDLACRAFVAFEDAPRLPGAVLLNTLHEIGRSRRRALAGRQLGLHAVDVQIEAVRRMREATRRDLQDGAALALARDAVDAAIVHLPREEERTSRAAAFVAARALLRADPEPDDPALIAAHEGSVSALMRRAENREPAWLIDVLAKPERPGGYVALADELRADAPDLAERVQRFVRETIEREGAPVPPAGA